MSSAVHEVPTNTEGDAPSKDRIKDFRQFVAVLWGFEAVWVDGREPDPTRGLLSLPDTLYES